MPSFVKLFVHFIIAVFATFVLASLSHSQFVLHELSRLGVEIDLPTRISSTIDDLLGLAPGYGGIIAAGLLIGFLVMGLVRKFRPQTGFWVYPLAGFLALMVTHIAMFPIFNVTLIAGAREPMGMLVQCLAGAFGGWAFMYCRQSNR